MLRENFVPRSLSARVFWLIVGVILLVEMLITMPGLGRERQAWLYDKVIQAQLMALSVTDRTGASDPQLGEVARWRNEMPSQFGADIDLNHESLMASMRRAGLAVLGLEAPYARVCITCPWQPKLKFGMIISQRSMAHYLRRYVARTAAMAIGLAVVTGGLVVLKLDHQLVRPMRVMTASIAGFRRNPGYAGLGGLKWLSERRDDDIARAARELVALQDVLRAALWRNARLAALGTSVAKISHDLRNILTSALLVADRFHHHADPMVKQAANTLIPAMERAVELVSRTVDFAQEGPPAVTRSPVALHALVNEVAGMLRATDGSVDIDNRVPSSLVLSLDRNQIYRVMVNLLRNAVEAGATRIILTVENQDSMPLLVIADNGPGLPSKVITNLFRPFTGSGRNGSTGLGLAIARDLIRAHGGDLQLRRTGPAGTEFAMGLSDELPEAGAAE